MNSRYMAAFLDTWFAWILHGTFLSLSVRFCCWCPWHQMQMLFFLLFIIFIFIVSLAHTLVCESNAFALNSISIYA